MNRDSDRGRWLAALSMALVLALPPAPAGAADEASEQLTPSARLEQAAATLPDATDAIALSSSLLGLLGQAIDAFDDGPWVPAVDPYGLPLNLTPPLPIASEARNRAYTDGCHARQDVRKAKGCTYGDPDADFTVLLMGDSHGAMWLPAFEDIAARRGWRIHLLTKSACPPARITVKNRERAYVACDAWRRSAFKLIERLRPDLAIVTSRVGYDIVGIEKPFSKRYLAAVRRGWADTMRTIGRSAGQVVVLNDGPRWTEDPIECLTEHADDVRACATPRRVAMRSDVTRVVRRAARDAGATFVDPSVLICPDDPCSVVDGRYLVVYDISHLTPVYSRLLSERLEAMLPIPRE
jgi:hypothetical protein